MNCLTLFVIVVAIVTILDLWERIPKFYARKLAHMLCGLIILQFDVSINGNSRGIASHIKGDNTAQNNNCVFFIYLIAITSILRCFFYPFRFGTYRDKGIIIYNMVVSLFFFFKLPLYVLTPIFFADPMAAIVGRNFPTHTIYKKKTCIPSSNFYRTLLHKSYHRMLHYKYISDYSPSPPNFMQLHGTLACFLVSLISLFYVGNYLHILILSVSLCLLELFGGTLDNLLMCFPIFIYMMFFNV